MAKEIEYNFDVIVANILDMLICCIISAIYSFYLLLKYFKKTFYTMQINKKVAYIATFLVVYNNNIF